MSGPGRSSTSLPTTMSKSDIPQDIIDTIIEAVDYSDLHSCALVSSSFLLPSRRRLFSHISLRRDQACQKLYQFLVDDLVIQSFVKSIVIEVHRWTWSYEKTFGSASDLNESTWLIAVLRLSFHRLERFSIDGWVPLSWKDLNSELKDALSTVIRLTTLKALHLDQVVDLPIALFQGCHITKLRLDSLSPNDFCTEKSNLLIPSALQGVSITSDTAIDHCEWRYFWPVNGPTEPIFMPFMCRLRMFEIYVFPNQFRSTRDLNFLSFVMRTLRVSLTTPATLEHLKLTIKFDGNSNMLAFFGYRAILDQLRHDDAWRSLDSIITHPTGSQLQRVDINIRYSFHYDDDAMEPDQIEVEKPVLDALPLLRDKGILFVEATVNG